MNRYHSHEAAQNRVPTDFGGRPFVVDIQQATLSNDTYRTALWTGQHLQLTVMNINPGDDIGLEAHPHVDQFLRVEQGQGVVQMGTGPNNLHFAMPVFNDYAVFVPAGTWHNITNTGNAPLKLYTIYAPPNHAFGTIHPTKEVAEAEEHH
ncbi:MAG: cupin domain-containing protein [Defluviitaleaceae bacterium]|nr:cupin domain-containing protein [Defluviitaleaceae bacterium]